MTSLASRKLLNIARTIFGLGLLGFLLYRIDPRALLDSFANVAIWSILAAILVQMSAKLVWTSRWQAILEAIGLRRRYSDLLQLLLVGVFFNSFLPSAVGGDLVRGYYAGKQPDRKLMSYASIVAERAVGLTSLAAMALVASIIALASDYPLSRGFLVALITVSGLLTTLGILGFTWTGWHQMVAKIPVIGSKLKGLAEAISVFHQPGSRAVWIVATSIALQVIAVLFHIACAQAVHLRTPALFFFLLVPISVVAAMIPITLNGLGVREGVLVGLLVQQGETPSDAGAFAVLALLISTLFALAGGIVYLSWRSPPGGESRSNPASDAND